MNKIQCIGAGFDLNYSSCSNKKPKTFSWTSEQMDNQVLVDMTILFSNQYQKESTQKRYGWVCESTSIVPEVVEALIQYHDVIFDMGQFEGIFTCSEKLLQLNERFLFCPPVSNLPWIPEEGWQMYPKSKNLSMFCSPKVMCEGHKFRHKIAQQNMSKLDLFGGAFNSPRIGISTDLNSKWNDKRDGLCDYRFHLVIENEQEDNYYTEKLTDCFATGTIPVYWGCDNVGDFFDSRGILKFTEDFDFNILTEDLYEEMLPYAENNLNIVKSLEMVDDAIGKNILNKE
jgi:hypothetical protein